jgi:hypothetical protein
MKTILTCTVAAVLVTAAFRLPLSNTTPTEGDQAKPISCCMTGAEGEDASCEDHPGKACLACVKKLEGSWYAADENGKATEMKMSEYSVTAGGTAVIETLFPGQDHEMVSVYYMEGNELMLTHYCVLGNHPKMKAKVDADSGQIIFGCTGKGENFASCKGTHHMHEGRITPGDANHYNATWTPMENDAPGEKVSFDLVRGS